MVGCKIKLQDPVHYILLPTRFIACKFVLVMNIATILLTRRKTTINQSIISVCLTIRI